MKYCIREKTNRSNPTPQKTKQNAPPKKSKRLPGGATALLDPAQGYGGEVETSNEG